MSHATANAIKRLMEWRDSGTSEDVSYCAGSTKFAADVALALREVERLRRERDQLISYLKGISRQTAEMVKAHNQSN